MVYCTLWEATNCVNNGWQLKENTITLKHKDNLPHPFPPAQSEVFKIRDIEVKIELKNLQVLLIFFDF